MSLDTARVRSPLGRLPPGIPGSPAWSGSRVSRPRGGCLAGRRLAEARRERPEPPVPVASPDRAPAARIARAAGLGPQVGGGARASRVPSPSSWDGASRVSGPSSWDGRSRQLAILWGSVWASARMLRVAGRDRREPRVAYGLRRLPGAVRRQVARPGPGGVARVGGALTREVRHERAVSAVDLARPTAVGAIRQSALDAALEVPRRARAHAVGRAPDPPGVSPESHGSRIWARTPPCLSPPARSPSSTLPNRASRPRPPSTGACRTYSPVTSWILYQLISSARSMSLSQDAR